MQLIEMCSPMLSSLSARRAWIEISLYTIKAVVIKSLSARRAWIEMCRNQFSNFVTWSLSARRAWIEIRLADMSAAWNRVALRKESVDRNPGINGKIIVKAGSLSARRAWIEMMKVPSD